MWNHQDFQIGAKRIVSVLPDQMVVSVLAVENVLLFE